MQSLSEQLFPPARVRDINASVKKSPVLNLPWEGIESAEEIVKKVKKIRSITTGIRTLILPIARRIMYEETGLVHGMLMDSKSWQIAFAQDQNRPESTASASLFELEGQLFVTNPETIRHPVDFQNLKKLSFEERKAIRDQAVLEVKSEQEALRKSLECIFALKQHLANFPLNDFPRDVDVRTGAKIPKVTRKQFSVNPQLLH